MHLLFAYEKKNKKKKKNRVSFVEDHIILTHIYTTVCLESGF